MASVDTEQSRFGCSKHKQSELSDNYTDYEGRNTETKIKSSSENFTGSEGMDAGTEIEHILKNSTGCDGMDTGNVEENDSKTEIENDSETEIENDSETEIENDSETEIENDSETEIENDSETEIENDPETEIKNSLDDFTGCAGWDTRTENKDSSVTFNIERGDEQLALDHSTGSECAQSSHHDSASAERELVCSTGKDTWTEKDNSESFSIKVKNNSNDEQPSSVHSTFLNPTETGCAQSSPHTSTAVNGEHVRSTGKDTWTEKENSYVSFGIKVEKDSDNDTEQLPLAPSFLQKSAAEVSPTVTENSSASFCIKLEKASDDEEQQLSDHTGSDLAAAVDEADAHVCIDCGKFFTSLSELEAHTADYSRKLFQCKFCLASFTRMAHLEDHLDTHGGDGGLCKERGAAVATSTYRTKHKVEKKTHNPGIKKEKEKRFKCQICPQAYARSLGLKNHVKRQHPDHYAHSLGKKTEKNKPLSSSSRKSKTPSCCAECGAEFARPKNLRIHLLTHSGAKPHTCSECGQSFSILTYLREHQRTHKAARPFTCARCHAAFKTSSNLCKHERIHSGDKRYVCPHCGMAFTQSGHLKQHAAKHSQVKPFVCSQCHAVFRRRESLRAHEKKHEGGVFMCLECGLGFNSSLGLKRHKHSYSKGSEPRSAAAEVGEENDSGSFRIKVERNSDDEQFPSPYSSLQDSASHSQSQS